MGILSAGFTAWMQAAYFAARACFTKTPNTSKLALLFLIAHLKKRGADWLDAQVMTPHLEVLGAKEVGRGEFLAKLAATQARGLELF